MRFNQTKESIAERTRTTNHEGGEAFQPEDPRLGLYKVVINNLLEDSYYESDDASFDKVEYRFEKCAAENPEFVLQLAMHARGYRNDDGDWEGMSLRQIPQLLLVFAANNEQTQPYVREYATRIMNRADEPLEVLAMQTALFGKSIPNPLQKGIENALHEFDEYEYAKYDSSRKEFGYRDLLNLVHPKPRDEEREEIFARIIRGPLDTYPDIEPLTQHRTWENTLSDDEDDRSPAEQWRETLGDMGLMAKIRNVRNMLQDGLEDEEILTDEDLDYVPNAKMFPFRYYTAYRVLKSEGLSTPYLDSWFEVAMDRAVSVVPDELGNTYVGVDLSGSMFTSLSDMSSVNMAEISALFGGITAKKGAKVGGFGATFKQFDFHSSTPALQMQQIILNAGVGHATNGHLVLEYMTTHNLRYENVALFTDMQMWDSTGSYHGTTSVREAWERYTEQVNPDANLYVIDLASYGELVTPEGHENVFNISGWTEDVIDHIKYSSNEGEIIREIEALSP